MKITFTFLLTILATQLTFGQVPDGFNYQAVLRNISGEILSNKNVSLRFSILESPSSSATLYQELHGTTTNDLGLITLPVGQGAVVMGDFTTIDWKNGPFFLRVELDSAGGNNFSALGVFQLLSVPFAMYAKTAENVDDADSDPTNELQNLSLIGNTLSLSGANQIDLPEGQGQWEANGNRIFYNKGFVGINTPFPYTPLQIIDTIMNSRWQSLQTITTILAESDDFSRAIHGSIRGQSDDADYSHRGVQGSASVDNLTNGGINLGVAGFANFARSNNGVYGRAGEVGDFTTGFNIGVNGKAESSSFVNRGTQGWTDGEGEINQGVYGRADGVGDGTADSYNAGIYGYSRGNSFANYGILGNTEGTASFNVGVYGRAAGLDTNAINYGVYGRAFNGKANYAGYFLGDVVISGMLSKSGGTFKIDHPLDPANRYLIHSFVESPDMMNIYNGNIITDETGFATVNLPAYFESANKDFKYQLTVIGTFAQAIIAAKLKDNKFVIQTDKPNVEVSWQITGVRDDLWAQKNRIIPEIKKSGLEVGRYLHPDLYGYSSEKGLLQPSPSQTGNREKDQFSISSEPTSNHHK